MMRTAVVVLALVLAGPLARAADMTVRELAVPVAGGDVQVRCYAAPGDAPLPVVVLLHGASGFTRFSAHYERYAEALVPHGLRVCAVLYYSADDSRVVAGTDRSLAGSLLQRRFMDWLAAIQRVVDRLGELPTTEPGAIGMLGFSQGAYLAVGVAGTHRSVRALVEFYGGFPFPLESRISRLPATLIVHGESDAVIPVQEAHALEAIASARATSYRMKLYPGAGHGFDMQADDPRAVDARQETVDFFVRHLKGGSK